MSPVYISSVAFRVSFPRVSGDEPHSSISSPSLALFSPRERG